MGYAVEAAFVVEGREEREEEEEVWERGREEEEP